MPGFFEWLNPGSADLGPDQLPPQLLANSMTLYAYDPVVWTNVTGSQNRVRLLTATDISNLYVNVTTAGILGFMPAGAETDASGNLTTLASPVALTGRQTIYSVPSVAYFEPISPVSSRAMSSIISALNRIGGFLWDSTTVTDSLIGTAVGINISTIGTNAPTFFWYAAATTKIGRIVQVDTQHPLFNVAVSANVQDTTHNTRCPVAVELYSTYNQWSTNVAYGN